MIVFSGAFPTTAMDRRLRLYRRLLEEARVGVVGNFLARIRTVEDYGEGMILMEPEQALAVIDRTRFRVQLRADYLRHDFTVGAIRWGHRSEEAGAAEAGSPSSAA